MAEVPTVIVLEGDEGPEQDVMVGACLREMTTAECFARLGSAGHGDISIPAGQRRLVAPVDYAVTRGTITFRIHSRLLDGTPMRGLLLQAWGTDGSDVWTVVVAGDGRDLTDPIECFAQETHWFEWGPPVLQERRFIRLEPRQVLGCRFVGLHGPPGVRPRP